MHRSRGLKRAPLTAPELLQLGRSMTREATSTRPDASALFHIGLAKPDVQLAQLLLVDSIGRMREQVLRALRLRESDHIADGFRARHERGDAIETESDTAVRRGSVLQRLEQETKFRLRFFRADIERAKH